MRRVARGDDGDAGRELGQRVAELPSAEMGARVVSLRCGTVMFPVSSPATTVAIGPERCRCCAPAYMQATAPSETSRPVQEVLVRRMRW